ncbi:MAG: DUF5706 domain-containing protein [Chitinophagales bacterium]|nr:DUF5706 domain-containing protein [Chitinophagales bacterium]
MNSQNEHSIVERAKNFVLQQFGQRQDGRLLIHNYALSSSICEEASLLAQQEQLPAIQQELTQLAALFLTSGYLYDYRQPAEYSVEAARQFLSNEQLPDSQQALISTIISETLNGSTPTTKAGMILADAAHICIYLKEQEEKHAQLQLERHFMLSQQYTKGEWHKLLLDELLRIQLYTHSAQAQYQPILAQSIHLCRLSVEKQANKAIQATDKYTELEKKVPVRGVQTYFRTNYRNHINLSSIADNKANIMIGINAILISVLITFLSYRNIGENNPGVLFPIIIFMATGLASLIFAVLSVRPKITMLNNEDTPLSQVKQNITFFGNFVHLSPETYEEAMNEVFSNTNLLYGNMVRDLYYLGKVLEKKYRYLTISYNIFMVGFIATVISFLIALFL